MNNLLQLISSKEFFTSSTGVSEQQISAAESRLGLVFSHEFREYLSAYGIASFDGHELTGIGKSTHLNVVDVTLEERGKYAEISDEWYVIEQLHIDDVSIWQASTGEVYQVMPGETPLKICDSLVEYIES